MPDDVTSALARAVALVDGRVHRDDVDALLADLDALSDRELVELDWRARSWRTGLGPGQVKALRSLRRGRHAHRLWAVLGLMSANGFDRELAVNETPLHRSTISLLALRAVDWVPQVRQAALQRLEAAPIAVVLDVLPFLDELTQQRFRADGLDALVERRFGDDELREATRSSNPATRRAAWRRLAARDACEPAELATRAVHDTDVGVRAVVVGRLDAVDVEHRRAIATALLGDRVGWLAARGLDALIELDGEPAIRAGLSSRTATVRRHARDWARLRGIDARSVYLDRLRGDATDALALTALAEIADPADRELLLGALRDRRARVRAAALKAIGTLDPPAARATAVTEIVAGRSRRVGRVAAAVLRGASLDEDDLSAFEAVALDPQRTTGERLRALGLLRPRRWRHLTTVLRARQDADPSLRATLDEELRTWRRKSGHVAHGPDPERRQLIASLLPDVDPELRRWISFVLRTAA